MSSRGYSIFAVVTLTVMMAGEAIARVDVGIHRGANKNVRYATQDLDQTLLKHSIDDFMKKRGGELTWEAAEKLIAYDGLVDWSYVMSTLNKLKVTVNEFESLLNKTDIKGDGRSVLVELYNLYTEQVRLEEAVAAIPCPTAASHDWKMEEREGNQSFSRTQLRLELKVLGLGDKEWFTCMDGAGIADWDCIIDGLLRQHVIPHTIRELLPRVGMEEDAALHLSNLYQDRGAFLFKRPGHSDL